MPLELVLVLGAVIVLAGYAAACRWWPFARCFRCGGSGRRPSTGTPFFIGGGVLALLGLATELAPLVILGGIVAAPGLLVRGGSFRNCPRCGGTGRRLRAGRAFVKPTK